MTIYSDLASAVAVAPRRSRRRPFAMVSLALALAVFATACASPDEDHATALVNRERATSGRADLSSNVSLILVAQTWSNHLAQTGSLSHRTPLSAGAPDRWTKLAENVGFGSSVNEVHGYFMNSPDHRANILDPAFNSIGVGVSVDGSGRVWVVEEFATL
jgi:uncharacterized protein YkwD